jgi:glutamate racemase
MGKNVTLVNTGEATAEVVKKLLESEAIASDDGNNNPVREFYTSDEPELFEKVAAPFLGEGLPSGTKHFATDKYEVTI